MTGVTPNAAVARMARRETLNLVGNLANNIAPQGLTRSKFKKPKRWSHQDELDSLKGRKIVLLFDDEAEAECVLIEADQFAIKVSSFGDNEQQSTLIYFKHTIAGFRAI